MGKGIDRFASRLEYSVFPVIIPEAGRGRRREIARQIVRGMYPSSLEGTVLMLRRNGTGGSYLAFVADASGRSGLFRSSTLYAAHLARRTGFRDGEIVVFDATYVEKISLLAGSVASTVARSRKAEPSGRLSMNPCVENGTMVICDKGDELARSIAERAGIAPSFFPDGLLASVTEAAYSLRPFSSRFVRSMGALALALTLFLASFAASRIADRAAEAAREAEARRSELEREKAESARQESLRAEYDRLLTEYNIRVLSRPYDPFSVLSLVHDAIGGEPKVRKMEMKGNDIAVSLFTNYPVPTLASLERNPYVYDLVFHDYGADRTKPGLFVTASLRYPKLREADGDLAERIADVRNRLRELTDRADKSPSLVSGYFDDLVSRARAAGCRLERVESLEEGGYVALSFLAKGPARSVLRFLKLTCTGENRLSYRSASVEYVQERSTITLTGLILTGIQAESGDRETASELMHGLARKDPAALTGLFYRADVTMVSDVAPKGPPREPSVQRAQWLRYMGYVHENDEELLYLRNELDGSTLRVRRSVDGSDGFLRATAGEIELLLGGLRYIIER